MLADRYGSRRRSSEDAADELAVAAATEAAEGVAKVAADKAVIDAADALGLAVAAATEAAEGVAKVAADKAVIDAADALRLAVAAATEAAEGVAKVAADKAAKDAADELMLAVAAQKAAEDKANLFATVNQTPGEGLAQDYDDVGENIYFVDPGTSEPAGNDVVIECPDTEVQTCVIVVTTNEVGILAYTSFGGEAELVNSRGVMDTRAAIALSGFGAGPEDGNNVPGALIILATTGPTIDTTSDDGGVKRSTEDGSELRLR